LTKPKKRVHIIVSGSVQGVGFRGYTLWQATECGVNGFVMNLHDGRVEIVAEGDEDRILEFIEKIRKGPPTSVVTKFQMSWETPNDEFSEFDIRFL